MGALAEGEHRTRVPADVESVRILEDAFVPVRRADQQKQPFPFEQLFAVELHIAG